MDANFWHGLLMEIANNVLGFLVSLLVASLVAIAVQYFRVLSAKLKAGNPEVYDLISKLAVEAVHAAEQLGLGGFIQNKKQFAIQYVQAELNARGIKGIDVAMIANKVEAAVYQEISKPKVSNMVVTPVSAPVVPAPVDPVPPEDVQPAPAQ